MEKLNKKKKIILILSSCLVILNAPKIKADESSYIVSKDYEIGSSIPFATYNDSNVYIGDQDFIYSIRDDKTNDVYILDQRDANDPSMSVINSYEIRKTKEMEKIIQVMLEYEELYPSKWNRTKNSMLIEWIMHNICYDINYKRERAEKVDLNNGDELKYKLFK